MGHFQKGFQRLLFAYSCFCKGKDSRFVKQVEAIGKNYNIVALEKSGGQSDNLFYLIDMKDIQTGFFAVYNRVLTLLYFADQYGLKPVIQYDQTFPYAEKHSVNGTMNPFEYYFEQPCGISSKDVENCKCVLISCKENSNLANSLNDDINGYSRSEVFLNELAKVSARYIRLNQTVKEIISNDIKPICQKKTLGVHVRGTDFKKNYNGHPIRVEINEYLSEAIKLFKTENYEQVFLATDDMEAIEQFKKEFGSNLFIFQDVIRSSGEDTVMNSINAREDHHYLLGLEVLRDMYSLANSDGLIAGLSQVSYAARIQKKSTGKDYLDMIIIDKGINKHRKENCPS